MLCTEQRDQGARLSLALIIRRHCWLIPVISYLGLSYNQIALRLNSTEQRVSDSAFGVFVELLFIHILQSVLARTDPPQRSLMILPPRWASPRR